MSVCASILVNSLDFAFFHNINIKVFRQPTKQNVDSGVGRDMSTSAWEFLRMQEWENFEKKKFIQKKNKKVKTYLKEFKK